VSLRARGRGGVNETPALAGQNPQYFVRTMQLFHGQQRANHTRRGMRRFAARLSAAEVAALATDYADMPASPGAHRR
jgi:cytochrome c553